MPSDHRARLAILRRADAIGIERRAERVILAPKRNVWRVEPAGRVAVLIDAAEYFGALREALINARSTVFILGWDLHSRTRLVGQSGTAGDGFPEYFIDLLTALVARRPQLAVYLLAWDHSVLYALERELFPTMSMHWRTPRRIRYCLDDALPAGASHHQKIVVVDDTLAFVGGLDVTTRRWDDADHRLDNPRRVDPTGTPYPPFHDIQAMVDGKAAEALAELVRQRWRRAAYERTRTIRPVGNPWPQSVAPVMTDVAVGIARTYPPFEEAAEIRECEALFLDSIDRAERAIFIENQYFTVTRFAERLAERLRQRPALEVVMVAPRTAHSWLEAQTMRGGLARFMRVFQDAGVNDRVALLYPQVCDGSRTADTMVHSKVMIVDDVLLRVGSANLNHRSFGLDTECDLAFEAQGAEHRRAIVGLRDRMLGHFCGATAQETAASIAHTGSLIAAARSLKCNGHSLEPIEIRSDEFAPLSVLEGMADPERPIPAPAVLRYLVGERPRARRLVHVAKIIGIGLVLVALILVWRLTPLSTLTDPNTIREWLAAIADMPAAALIVPAVFVIAGLLVFPVLLLIAATAVTFGPWLGLIYATTGALASAIVTYAVGAAIGRRAVESVMGPRLNRVRRSFVRGGVLAVAAVRLVPVAPFSVVNLVAGASRIPFMHYLVGTIIGMAPGLAVLSALGHQMSNLLTAPSLLNLVLFILAVLVWLAASIGVQALILRWRRHT